MQLIRQLKDEELTEFLLQREEQEIRQIFAALPESLQSATEKPGWFWQRQVAEVHERMIAGRRELFRPMAAWAVGMALVVLALSLLRHSPTPRPVQAQNDSDQELLVAVEQAVDTEGPASLEPAALLADEIGSAQAVSRMPRVQKETRHEN